MQAQQQDYYNPSTQDGFDDGTVLKAMPFRPFRNRKTNRFFSYSYATIERNRSGNSDSNMEWVTRAPKEMQDKIDRVRAVHDDIHDLYEKMKKMVKKGTQYQVDELKEVIDERFADINEIIYPDADRIYVESAEAKRARLEQQNELTLDAASIAALRGEALAPMGSTADASIAEVKLQLAEEKLAKMQEQIDNNAQGEDTQPEKSQDEKDVEIAMLREQLTKSPSRRKAEFKQ